MSNNVILTEPTDRIRRADESNSKRMRYLVKDNTQLKEQVKDLKNLVELNRQALQVMTQMSATKSKDQRYSDMSKVGQETYSTVISRGDDFPGENPLKGQLVNLLIQENKKLAEKLDQMIEERNTAQNRAYLNERIIQQNIEFEEEMTHEYKEKIEFLKMNIRTKEYILHELECLRMIPASTDEVDSKTYMVFREISAPFKTVGSLTNEKKMLENELIDERVANSKVRKDYKSLFDKASYLAIELRKLRSVLSNRLATQVCFTEPDIEQYKASTRQFKQFRMKSVDEKLLRAQSRHSLFDSKPTPSLISPKKVPSFARQGDASIKKNNYVDNLVTSRYNNSKDEPLTTYDGHEVSARDLEMVKENKILCKLLSLATAKNNKMKEELKKAKLLLKTTAVTNERLRTINIERNNLIDNLRRELAFFEDRFYVRLGASKGHKSFCEGGPSDEKRQAKFLEEKQQEIEADEDRMVNVSMLDQSNIMDISRVNKHSVMKRKRNNKGSIHVLPKEKENFFKKSISPEKTTVMSAVLSLSKQKSSQNELQKQMDPLSPQIFTFEEINYKEAFKIEESKAYLTQLAKELMLMTNSRAKFAFSKMKNKKYIDFGTLPTPVVKVDRSVSCPPLTFSRKARVTSPHDADTTLVFDKPGMQMLGDDYSIDYDFDDFKKLMKSPNF